MSTAQLLLVETESLFGSEAAQAGQLTQRATTRSRTHISPRYILDQTTLSTGRAGIATARAILAEAAVKRTASPELHAQAA
jgi:hypothetical protein